MVLLTYMENECTICYDEMINPVAIECGHYYHNECIKLWFKKNWICPIDRKNVDLKVFSLQKNEIIFVFDLGTRAKIDSIVIENNKKIKDLLDQFIILINKKYIKGISGSLFELSDFIFKFKDNELDFNKTISEEFSSWNSFNIKVILK